MSYLFKENYNTKGYFNTKIFSDFEVNKINYDLENLRLKRNKENQSWGEYDMYLHPHKESTLILKLFGHPLIISLLEQIMDDEVEGIQSMAYFKPPGELGRDAHQDGIYTQSGWGKSINVLISLDDMDESNGCLWSFESSHFLPILPIEVDEDRLKTNPDFWKNERGKKCVMPNGHNFKKVYHVCERGDVLFAHDYLVHGSEENKSNNFRRSLILSYKTKNSNLRQGNLMKREPFDVYEILEKYWKI